jgi:hypothetical protein
MADLIDELALDVLPGDERAEALAHLDGCPTCREQLEALSQPADLLLFACRRIRPPAGFEDRVLARLASERRRPGPPRRRLALVAAAVAAVASAAFIGAGGVPWAGGARHPVGTSAEGHELRTVTLMSTAGQPIGDVSAYAGPPTWFFLRVDHGDASGRYQCVLDVDGGRTIALGAMWVSNGEGGWGQQVGVDARLVRAARLVDGSGRTLAVATFH